jgi:type II secretory pathway pseudopilin PulG
MKPRQAFTLIELLVLVSVIALLIGVLLPFLGAARRTTSGTQNGTQVRGIHQGMVLYSNGNGSYYPGLDRTGALSGAKVEERFKPLLDGNYFVPQYLVNPAEPDPTIVAWTGPEPMAPKNYSYALPQLPESGGRHDEWRDTSNPKAIAISDRNEGTDAHANVRSPWTVKPGDWPGSVAFNDNSTSFVTTHRLDLQYGDIDSPDDNIFAAAGDSDAYMIRAGNE